MATSTPHDPRISAEIDLFLSRVGQGFNAYLERRGRIEQVMTLERKSDAELAEMGLTRDRLVEHAFRDLFAL